MNNLSAIVVIAENSAIGKNNDLLCHLPADLKHFKELTMGHTIIMGRRTFESLPKGALPGRENIVVTRNADYQAAGAVVCHSVDEALQKASMPGERFIIGGAQLYAATIDKVDMLHLTELHASFADADTFFPQINRDEWQEVERIDCQADERNRYSYSFVTLKKK
ncbi:MAG: dihydrofolate reductase [Bacteroidales bacterium]|nr:dihydrofolate reductase [Bacteroidales bacterium]